MILLIDNYDSFTYNLYHSLQEEVEDIRVVRNDKITIEEIEEMDIEAIVISPGPKAPKDAGICLDVIKKFHKTTPILGVCLGHQSIGEAFGGNVIKASKTMHGKVSELNHDNASIFDGIKNRTKIARYHSLIIEKESIPSELEVTATTDDGEIMAIKHREYPIVGVQFHPESFFSEDGQSMIKNFFRGL